MPVKSWARNEIVQLNVGGQKFSTTVDTLTKETDSMLGVWFSGRHDIRLDSEGRVFIDRDGFRFRHILNFLRNGSVHIAGDIVTYQEILEEARYFGIVSLEKRLTEEIQKLEALGHEDNMDNIMTSQTSNSSGVNAENANPALLLTGSWLLQKNQAQAAKSSQAPEAGEGGDDSTSVLTQSHQTEYRFSLDEDF
mmetsp:Transcript_24312/g.35088  ORF Transcript_24312/g.35088 Transcript_24312/m.35088 type:complete len:194 (+) Transcript_24312:587-1168(+)